MFSLIQASFSFLLSVFFTKKILFALMLKLDSLERSPRFCFILHRCSFAYIIWSWCTHKPNEKTQFFVLVISKSKVCLKICSDFYLFNIYRLNFFQWACDIWYYNCGVKGGTFLIFIQFFCWFVWLNLNDS